MTRKIIVAGFVVLIISLVGSLAAAHGQKRRADDAVAAIERLEHELAIVRADVVERVIDLSEGEADEDPVAPVQDTDLAPTESTDPDTGLAERQAEIETENYGLRAQLASLQQRLAEAEAETEKRAASDREREERRNTFRERFTAQLEEMKREDPERYKEIQERREQMQRQITDNLARQSVFVLNLDTEQMTDDQKRSHERLIEIMEENWASMESLKGEPQAEGAHEARHTLWRNMSEMRELFPVEREAALTELGRDLGYEGDDVKAFSDTITEIIDMTSIGSYRRRHAPDITAPSP